MPRLLVNRLKQEDSIRQFRAAANLRNREASYLADSGHPTAAIYLWGYVAEMTLKAGWFQLIGFPKDRLIGRQDLRSALDRGKDLGIQFGNLHDLFHWAQLLVEHRMDLGCAYSPPTFGDKVVEHSNRIYQRWRETLRYKTNRPYASEVRTVSESAQWLLSNSLRL